MTQSNKLEYNNILIYYFERKEVTPNYETILINQLIFDENYFKIINGEDLILKNTYLSLFSEYFQHCEKKRKNPSNMILCLYNSIFENVPINLPTLLVESINYKSNDYKHNAGYLSVWFLASFKQIDNIKNFLKVLEFNNENEIETFLQNLIVVTGVNKLNTILICLKEIHPDVYHRFTDFYYSGGLLVNSTYFKNGSLILENLALIDILDKEMLSEILNKATHEQIEYLINGSFFGLGYDRYLSICKIKLLKTNNKITFYCRGFYGWFISQKFKNNFKTVNQQIYNFI